MKLQLTNENTNSAGGYSFTGYISEAWDGHEIRLPKTQLVSTLVAAFDAYRVLLGKESAELDAMKDELSNYEIHISDEGRDQYGVFIGGTYDDLVTALALATWCGESDLYEPIKMW